MSVTSTNNQVFVIFKSFGDGDGYTQFKILEICHTLEKAQEIIVAYFDDKLLKRIKEYASEKRQWPESLCHDSISKENNYTFVGKRSECKECFIEDDFGGYVIESMEVR